MYKHLYSAFKHWYISKFDQNRVGQVYFYADPHFADKEIEYLRKNYIGDDAQVKSINSVVSKHDTLVLLGDIGDVNYLKKIKAGRKILILGNHDRGASYYQEYCDEIYEGALIISPKIILSHEPVDFPYSLNIHGHTHNIHAVNDDMHFTVIAEKINYKPVCLKHIVESGILKNIPDMHRNTIDRAVLLKQNKEDCKDA